MTLNDIFNRQQVCEMTGLTYIGIEFMEKKILKEGVDFKSIGRSKIYTQDAVAKIKQFKADI